MATHPAAQEQTHDAGMPHVVRRLLDRYTGLWWQSETYTPPLGPIYSRREQERREAILASFQETMIVEVENPPRTRAEMAVVHERVETAAAGLLQSTLDLEHSHLRVIKEHSLLQAALAFARQARRFDPAVRGEDIFQASRNAWTMFGLQLLMGLPVRLTPSIFAYSMLYPYSDNYLDDPTVPEETKLAFNERFRRRLGGDHIAPANGHEQTIFALVEMIESEYRRDLFPQVFDSLLAIHQAQDKSIRLLRRNVSPYEVDVLGISLEKGGTSVLADGYLVAGDLAPDVADFMFGWGALMQLLDDLQDVEDDARAGLMTVYSKTARRSRWDAVLAALSGASRSWPLDSITNRTLHFGFRVMDSLSCFAAPGSEPFKEVMRRAVTLSFAKAVGGSAGLYTPAYVVEIEQYMPFRFWFLSTGSPFSRRQMSLRRMIETLAQNDERFADDL